MIFELFQALGITAVWVLGCAIVKPSQTDGSFLYESRIIYLQLEHFHLLLLQRLKPLAGHIRREEAPAVGEFTRLITRRLFAHFLHAA